MQEQFKRYTNDSVNKIHLKKKNDFIKDVDHFMMNIRQFLDYHFNRNQATKTNPYLYIDALVWSIAYFEKLPRYDDSIYIFSEYLVKQYEYLETLSFEDILNCNINFDVFRMNYDFK